MFDAHHHLSDEVSLAAALKSHVSGVLLAGTRPSDWSPAAALSSPSVGWSAGLHPWWVDQVDRDTWTDGLRRLRGVLETSTPTAIGECGLDRTRGHASRQELTLREHLQLAHEFGLPIVLHVVRATGLALSMVEYSCPARGGLVHGFSGSREVAQRWVTLGFFLGIGPALLRNRGLQERIRDFPRDALVVESDDTPTMTTLPRVVEALAACRDEDPTDTARYTEANARRLFGPL